MSESLERLDIIRSRRKSSVKEDELPPASDSAVLPEGRRSSLKPSLLPLPSPAPSSAIAAAGAGAAIPSLFPEKQTRDIVSGLIHPPSGVRDLPPLTAAPSGGGEKEDGKGGGSPSSIHGSSGGHRHGEHRKKMPPDDESSNLKQPLRSLAPLSQGGSPSTKTNTKNNTHDDDYDDDDRPAVVTIVSAALAVEMEDNADNSSSLVPLIPGGRKPRKAKRPA